MSKPIQVILQEECREFFKKLPKDTQQKLLFCVDKTEKRIKGQWFAKLNEHIYEFRIQDGAHWIRILSFWDSTPDDKSLIICCCAFSKKENKTPKNQIEKAEKLRTHYFS